MIKHMSQSHQLNKNQSFNQFQTFQLLPHDQRSIGSNKDSLLFSQSRKADEIERELIHSNKINKQEWQEQLLRSRTSSIKKNKFQSTIKESDQNADPLSRYVISTFDPKTINPSHARQNNIKSQRQASSICTRCRLLQQEHKKQISFLTKNNQELYELNKKLTEQLNQFAKKFQKLQNQSKQTKKQMCSIIQQNMTLRQKKDKIEEKYYQRQNRYLRQKQINLKTNEKQLQIVSQIQSCLHVKELRSKSKELTYRFSPNIDNKLRNRIKTEYDGQNQNRNAQTAATWEVSHSKHSPRKIQISRQIVSQQKLRGQIDTKVSKLSQQKRKIMQRVAKQNLTIKDLQSSEIPKAALNKMGKGNVGKLTLGKSSMGKSSSSFYGVSSMIQKRR